MKGKGENNILYLQDQRPVDYSLWEHCSFGSQGTPVEMQKYIDTPLNFPTKRGECLGGDSVEAHLWFPSMLLAWESKVLKLWAAVFLLKWSMHG